MEEKISKLKIIYEVERPHKIVFACKINLPVVNKKFNVETDLKSINIVVDGFYLYWAMGKCYI